MSGHEVVFRRVLCRLYGDSHLKIQFPTVWLWGVATRKVLLLISFAMWGYFLIPDLFFRTPFYCSLLSQNTSSVLVYFLQQPKKCSVLNPHFVVFSLLLYSGFTNSIIIAPMKNSRQPQRSNDVPAAEGQSRSVVTSDTAARAADPPRSVIQLKTVLLPSVRIMPICVLIYSSKRTSSSASNSSSTSPPSRAAMQSAAITRSVKGRPVKRFGVSRAFNNLVILGNDDLILEPSSVMPLQTQSCLKTVIDLLKRRETRRSPHQAASRSTMIIITITSMYTSVQVMRFSADVNSGNGVSTPESAIPGYRHAGKAMQCALRIHDI